MRLSRALRLEPGQVIAFVGAGGKSSAIRVLVEELVDEVPVLVTTTTKFALEQSDLAKQHQIIDDSGSLITALASWQPGNSLLLTGPRHPAEPRWDGLSIAHLHDLIEFSREQGAVLLIEADGAAGRSVKAPAAHEPALIDNIDLVVPVVGIDALGAQLDSRLVHRPDEISNLLGLDLGTRLEVEHIAALLTHPEGALKSVPAYAKVRVLINMVSTDDELEQARKIAALALSEDRIQAVLIGAVQEHDPVREVRGRVAAIVLAAGASTRFDGNKLLRQWKGLPLLDHVLEVVRQCQVDRRVLVLGSGQEQIQEAINHQGFELTSNEAWADGQSTSVQAGLDVVVGDVEAAIYLLGDMPLVPSSLVDALASRYAETLKPIVAPRVEGEWGNPVLFDRATFMAFSELSGDRGAKTLFPRFEIEPVEAGLAAKRDIDHPGDLGYIDRKHGD